MKLHCPDPDRPSRLAARKSVRGLYGIADFEASGGNPVGMVRALLEGGCRLVQLRCKGVAADEVLRFALQTRALTRAVGAAFVVNDDPDLALEADADGLHLGQLDGSVGSARALLGTRWIGRSTHEPSQVAEAVGEGSDYVAFGPVFQTPHLSRPKPVRGVDRLAEIRDLLPAGMPLVAIGGITAERLTLVRGAGADSWAAIGAIAHAPEPRVATAALLGPLSE